MDSDQRMASWLKATIRTAMIAAAVGGGLFVLSQVLAPSEAHADTVSASAPSDDGDSLLRPVLQDLGSTLGAVTGTVDSAVSSVSPVAPAATSAVSSVVSSTVNALPAPVKAPVKQATAPIAATVTQVTAPVTKTTSGVAAKRPVSAVLGTVSGTVDGVVDEVETVPIVGGLVSEVAGHDPVSTVTSPAAAGLDDTVSAVSSTVGATLAGACDVLPIGEAGDGSDGVPPVVGSLLQGAGASSPSGDAADLVLAAPVAPQATTPSGAPPSAVSDPLSAVASPGVFAQAAVAQASAGSTAPSGLPAGPLSPLNGLSGSGASASGGGRSGGSDPLQLAGALGAFDFPAASAGLSSLVDDGALPASPVFEHDSSPD